MILLAVGNSLHLQDISIVRHDKVLLTRVPMVLHNATLQSGASEYMHTHT